MELSDAELARICLNGDNQAFDVLVKRYQKRIISFCRRMLGDADLAADAAQESFLKAYNALEAYRQDAPFLSWMFKISSNTCLDHLRKRSRERTDPIEAIDGKVDENHTPEDRVLDAVKDDIIRQAILELPETYREVLTMFYFGELKVREIACALGLPEGTVKSDLHQAREILRQKLTGVS